MPPSGDPSHDADDRNAPNPFVAFKRFADEQFSSLISSAFGSNPFIINPPISLQNFKEQHEAWPKTCQEREGRLHKSKDERAESSYPPQQCPYRGSETTKLSVQETEDLRTFLDHEATRADSKHRAGTSSLIQGIPAIPIFYLYNSDYSPLHLEREQSTRDQGNLWRAAFEDLLRVNNDLPMTPKPDEADHMTENPHIWMRNLLRMAEVGEMKKDEPRLHDQINRSLTAGLPRSGSVARHSSAHSDSPSGVRGTEECGRGGDIFDSLLSLMERARVFGVNAGKDRQAEVASNSEDDDDDDNEGFDDDDDNDDDELEAKEDEDDDGLEEEQTELDMVERLLRKRLTPEDNKESQIIAALNRGSTRKSPESTKPSVLSTLTTTKTTTLPDGTTKTEVTLRKRFSDGREESTETIHTQNPILQRLELPSVESKKPHESPNTESRKENGKAQSGWFWN